MALCPSCGAERALGGGPCVRCGGKASRPESAVPDLELDVPVRRPAKAAMAKKQPEPEISLELAIEPVIHPANRSLAPRAPEGIEPAVHDLAFDARLLAEYGDPPGHWILSPLYAWRVLRRQRELKHVIAGRREEAGRTATELEDALVAFAERVRSTAERNETYASLLDEVKVAEEALRSRDRVLAADQDAQTGRLASVDAQLSKLEAELAQVQAEERAVLAAIADAQGALSRADAKVKRAETELRAAQRAPDRTAG